MKHIENLNGQSLQLYINKMIYEYSYNFNPNALILGSDIIYKLLSITNEQPLLYLNSNNELKFKTMNVVENRNDKNCIMICKAIDCLDMILEETTRGKINIDSGRSEYVD
jgi:hypothetical protein